MIRKVQNDLRYHFYQARLSCEREYLQETNSSIFLQTSEEERKKFFFLSIIHALNRVEWNHYLFININHINLCKYQTLFMLHFFFNLCLPLKSTDFRWTLFDRQIPLKAYRIDSCSKWPFKVTIQSISRNKIN